MFRVLYSGLCIAALILTQAAHAQDVMAQDIMTLIKNRQTQAPDTRRIVPQSIPYSYLVSTSVQEEEEGESLMQAVQYRVNPQRAAGERITVMSGSLEALPEEAREEIEAVNAEQNVAALASEFWCNSEDDGPLNGDDPEDDLGEGVTVISENDVEAVLGLDIGLLKGMLTEGDEDDGMPNKIVKRMAAQVTVTKPDLEMKSMRVWLTRPVRVMLVAKIKEMDIRQSCALAPNGHWYASERQLTVRGKALGVNFSEQQSITISDLQPLP